MDRLLDGRNWVTILRKIKSTPHWVHKQTLAPNGLKTYFQRDHQANRKYLDCCDLCAGKGFFFKMPRAQSKRCSEVCLTLLRLPFLLAAAAGQRWASRVTIRQFRLGPLSSTALWAVLLSHPQRLQHTLSIPCVSPCENGFLFLSLPENL